MIFVCLGTQIFQMNRLLKEIDRLVEEGIITEPIFAQTGKSDYRPLHYTYKDFITPEEYQSYVEQADLIITHGGTGAIIKGLRARKQIIAIPRLYRYREHENDHQIEIVDFFSENGYIRKIVEVSELKEAIWEIRKNPITKYFQAHGNINELVQQFIEQNETIRKEKVKKKHRWNFLRRTE